MQEVASCVVVEPPDVDLKQEGLKESDMTPDTQITIANDEVDKDEKFSLEIQQQVHSLFSLKSVETESSPFYCECCQIIFYGLSTYYKHRLEHNKCQKKSGLYDDDNIPKKRFMSDRYDPKIETELLLLDIYDQRRNMYKTNELSDDRYECLVCNETFTRRRYLDRHILFHKGFKPYICVFCNRKFSAEEYLRAHMKVHYLPENRPFKCGYCYKKFYTQSGVQHHELLHAGGKQHKCAQCSKAFYTQYALDKHMKAHANEKLFQCRICPRKFNFKSTLNNHIREHFVEPLSCKYCQKKFTNKYYFAKHERAHISKQSYPCDLCEKVYAQEYNMKEHRKQHFIGKQTYTCAVCSKIFKDKYSMKYHFEAHSGERLYSCEICRRTFLKKFQLNHHMRYNVNCRQPSQIN